MTKIATNEQAVTAHTTAMTDAVAQVNYSAKEKIAYSESTATSDLKTCIADMKKATKQFKGNLTTDIGNLKKIHEAIKKTDDDWGRK